MGTKPFEEFINIGCGILSPQFMDNITGKKTGVKKEVGKKGAYLEPRLGETKRATAFFSYCVAF